MTYYIPQYKHQLIDWLVKVKHYTKSTLKGMSKPQLYAIYFKIRSALVLTLAISALWTMPASADVSDQEGVACIIGEASNQGFDGLLAVADALQNRGTTKGVYGCKAKHVNREPAYVWTMAKNAWQRAKIIDVVGGASFWENTEAFGVPYWAKKMKKTIKIGCHTFYKKG